MCPRMLEKNRRRSGWRWWRPFCWCQVPVPWQIRPIDHGRDHKPLIRRGDRGHYSSRLALIRERALSRRLVHSLLQSARARALPSTPPVCARDRSLSVHKWAPGRARGPTGAISSPSVTGGSAAQRPRLICHPPPHHHRTTTTHSRPLLTFFSTTQRVLRALRVILHQPKRPERRNAERPYRHPIGQRGLGWDALPMEFQHAGDAYPSATSNARQQGVVWAAFARAAPRPCEWLGRSQ